VGRKNHRMLPIQYRKSQTTNRPAMMRKWRMRCLLSSLRKSSSLTTK